MPNYNYVNGQWVETSGPGQLTASKEEFQSRFSGQSAPSVTPTSPPAPTAPTPAAPPQQTYVPGYSTYAPPPPVPTSAPVPAASGGFTPSVNTTNAKGTQVSDIFSQMKPTMNGSSGYFTLPGGQKVATNRWGEPVMTSNGYVVDNKDATAQQVNQMYTSGQNPQPQQPVAPTPAPAPAPAPVPTPLPPVDPMAEIYKQIMAEQDTYYQQQAQQLNDLVAQLTNMNTAPVQQQQPVAPVMQQPSYTRPSLMGLPPELAMLGSMDETQQRSYLASQGVYGNDGTNDAMKNYYLNLLQRVLIGDSGTVNENVDMLPVERQYLQSLGIPLGSTGDILRGINNK